MSTPQSLIMKKAVGQARVSLAELLSLCTPEQINVFQRMYPEGIENVPLEKLDWACKQVENTLAKRKDN